MTKSRLTYEMSLWACLGEFSDSITEVEALPTVEQHHSLARILVYIKSAAASILCSYS